MRALLLLAVARGELDAFGPVLTQVATNAGAELDQLNRLAVARGLAKGAEPADAQHAGGPVCASLAFARQALTQDDAEVAAAEQQEGEGSSAHASAARAADQLVGEQQKKQQALVQARANRDEAHALWLQREDAYASALDLLDRTLLLTEQAEKQHAKVGPRTLRQVEAAVRPLLLDAQQQQMSQMGKGTSLLQQPQDAPLLATLAMEAEQAPQPSPPPVQGLLGQDEEAPPEQFDFNMVAPSFLQVSLPVAPPAGSENLALAQMLKGLAATLTANRATLARDEAQQAAAYRSMQQSLEEMVAKQGVFLEEKRDQAKAALGRSAGAKAAAETAGELRTAERAAVSLAIKRCEALLDSVQHRQQLLQKTVALVQQMPKEWWGQAGKASAPPPPPRPTGSDQKLLQSALLTAQRVRSGRPLSFLQLGREQEEREGEALVQQGSGLEESRPVVVVQDQQGQPKAERAGPLLAFLRAAPPAAPPAPAPPAAPGAAPRSGWCDQQLPQAKQAVAQLAQKASELSQEQQRRKGLLEQQDQRLDLLKQRHEEWKRLGQAAAQEEQEDAGVFGADDAQHIAMVQALRAAQEQGEAAAQEPVRQLLAATQELQEVSRVGAVRVGEASKLLLPALSRAAKAVEGAVALKQRARDEQAEHQLDLDKEVAQVAQQQQLAQQYAANLEPMCGR